MTLDAVISRYEEAVMPTLRTNTRSLYRTAHRRISRSLGRRRITAIDRADVRRFVADMSRDGLKANTIAAYIAALHILFTFAADDLGVHVAFPRVKLPRPADDQREHRVLTDDELARILDACAERSRLYFRTLAETGSRQSEALGLRMRDVGDGSLTFERQRARDGSLQPLKTRRSKRTIEITRGLSAQLRLGGDGDRVFPLLDQRMLNRDWHRAVEAAEIDEPTPVGHDLRHTHASRLIALGWDPVEVAKRLGDRVETVLKTYAHEFDARRRGAERRAVLEQLYGQDGDQMATKRRPQTTADIGKVVEFPADRGA
ncbi:MAG: tyrosine-type recombinase/integrase [Solirubrobacteraceae bacterium]|jgi:integrase